MAKSHNAVGLEKIKAHSCVTKAFETPCGFVFFKFYHDLLFKWWNQKIGGDLPRDSDLKKELDRLGYEKNDLLGPLHSEIESARGFKSVTGFGFHINDVYYQYLTDRRVRSLVLKRAVFMPGKKDIVLRAEFRPRKNSGQGTYEKTLREWHDWCRNSGSEISMGRAGFRENRSEVGVRIRKEPEDSLAVLVMMLHDRKGRIGLSSIDISGR